MENRKIEMLWNAYIITTRPKTAKALNKHCFENEHGRICQITFALKIAVETLKTQKTYFLDIWQISKHNRKVNLSHKQTLNTLKLAKIQDKL